MYMINLAKVDNLELCLMDYNLKRISLIGVLISGLDQTQLKDPCNLWTGNEVDMIKDWDNITRKQSCLWQYNANKRVHKDN